MPGYFNCPRSVAQITKKKVGRVLLIFIFLQLLFHGIPSYAQRTKIDSLKKALLSLHDSARIECLNLLSLAYSYLNSDTAKSFAKKAYTESSVIHYLPGELMALNNIARIAGHGSHDFLQQEKISLQIIQQYKDGSDPKVLVDAYMNLALALFCQSAFEKSTDACRALIQLTKKTGDKKRMGEALTIIGCINLETGNYEKSFDYFNESLGIFRSIGDSYNTAILLAKVGDIYRLAGDHKTALNFYFQSLEYPKGPSLQWHPLVDLGDTYYSLEQFDSTLYENEKYIQSIKSLTVRSNYIAYPNIRTAEMYIASKEYDKAISLLNEEFKNTKTKKEENQLMRLLLDISRAYQGQKNTRMAFFYTKELLQRSQTHKARQYIRDAYKLMSTLYDHLHNIDSAYSYYRKYTDMKDSVAFDDLSKKLAVYTAAKENEKKQAQIELLNNEKLIDKQQLQLGKQQLQNESLLRNVLIVRCFLF